MRLHFPSLYAEPRKPANSIVGDTTRRVSSAVFSENLLAGGKKLAPVNVLMVDVVKPDFDRSIRPNIVDPNPQVVFDFANSILARIRVYSRASQIKPIVIGRDSWLLRYLSEDGEELPVEEGKARGRRVGHTTLGYPPVSPEVFGFVATLGESDEPYVWDQLILDAHDLLPEVGSSIVMAYAALESFIVFALDHLEGENPLPGKLWPWIKHRDNEHWIKGPSVSEKFDILLYVLTGHSLKDEQSLWQGFTELRKARNKLMHEGIAVAAGRKVDAVKAEELVTVAQSVITWVERLLPEKHRRARTTASGPFIRRIATPEESDAFGRVSLIRGKLGEPLPVEGIYARFEPKSMPVRREKKLTKVRTKTTIGGKAAERRTTEAPIAKAKESGGGKVRSARRKAKTK